MTGETEGSPVIVTLPAEIDITNVGCALDSLLHALDNSGLVIADMTGTTFCDSAGLRMLITARDRAAHSGSTLRVVIRPDGSVARVLAILGMDRMLPVYASLREAVPAQPGTRQHAP